MEYAGRWQRIGAVLIDIVIVLVILAILNLVGLVGIFEGSRGAAAVQAVVALAYYVPLTVRYGATVGKMALGIKVVGPDGNTPSAGPVFIRETIVRALGSILSFILGSNVGGGLGGLIFLIVVAFILFDDKRQGLHDKAAGTFVVRAK